MTTTRTFRLFAITSAIAITLVGPEARGFAIHRTNSTSTEPPTEISSDESFRLQVRDDLRRPNNITTQYANLNRTKNNEDSNKVIEIAIGTPQAKTENHQNIGQTTAAVKTTTENNKIPTISSDTVEVFDSIEDIENYNNTEKPINHDEEPLNFTRTEFIPIDKSAENKLTTTVTSFSKTQPPIEIFTIVDHVATDLDQFSGKNATRKTVERSIIINKEETTQPCTATERPVTTDSATEILTIHEAEETVLSITESSINTGLPQVVSNNNNDMISKADSSNVSNSDVTQATENVNTKITDTTSENDLKYVTVINKPTTKSEVITMTPTTEKDEMKVESSNAQANIAKTFDITPIPSLEKLRADLLSKTNLPLIDSESRQRTEKKTRKAELTTPYMIESTELKKLGIVETKRAGYIDNSEKLTTPVTISSVSDEIKENITESYATANSTMVTISPIHENVSSSESQRQLAEDELQEEFLKEEVLNNRKENAIRYHDKLTTIEPVKFDNSSVLASIGTEDSLSVQPIERTKTTLYTLSPNYKPMKKIDVQPAKPFVRDPDDNSWRNESISSLGIVFKPKNSSKSFKEVLKNKTQTELNSLIERTKDDVPDLRVRLEKIAEVRKTKKKKMNKDGEVIYSDYEENSAETSTSKQAPNSTILSSAEIAKMLTPLDYHPELPNKLVLETTTPMTTLNNMEERKEKPIATLDIFSRFGLDPLTTQKPKKFFNMAEYYDTTDEYDADYVTMSKLDLKKFTTPPRSTRPSTLITKPIEPYVPERRPTVQYFPPREPAVNVNSVDKDFERKINLFTFKDHPRIEPRPPFVTVPPLTIATIKAEELGPVPPPKPRPDIMRPTAKPTDLIYPPELDKNHYLTNVPPKTTESEAFLLNSGRIDRGSYIIKHYKDFLNAAVDDVYRTSDFLPRHTTEAPRETIASEADRQTHRPRDYEEDYDSRFRKEVLSRFVDNFNQNSERFKVDFPILYNNSIVHRKGEGSPASSRTFLKRLYHEGVATKANGLIKKPCEPNCELTVELSPAYELHYYVPNQEERQEQEPRTSGSPYRYGL